MAYRYIVLPSFPQDIKKITSKWLWIVGQNIFSNAEKTIQMHKSRYDNTILSFSYSYIVYCLPHRVYYHIANDCKSSSYRYYKYMCKHMRVLWYGSENATITKARNWHFHHTVTVLLHYRVAFTRRFNVFE